LGRKHGVEGKLGAGMLKIRGRVFNGWRWKIGYRGWPLKEVGAFKETGAKF
jgi:hypothetical protein